MRAPAMLAAILPPGMLGLTVAAMIALFISTSDTYLHSWGSILVQDIILPFRKRPFTTRGHLRLLRAGILGVAVFVFVFSLNYRPSQYVQMFLALTGAVFVGGAGSAIIGGLYWKRGTTEAAWSAMIVGMLLSAVGIACKQMTPELVAALAGRDDALHVLHAPIAWLRRYTGQELTLFAIVASIATYVLVSLLGPRRVFDMDRLLHRGRYAIAAEQVVGDARAPTILERLGFTREFSGRDRVVTYVTLAWPLAWTAVFIVVTLYNLRVDVPERSWMIYWKWWTLGILASGIAVTIWFSIGAIRDMRRLFADLRSGAVNVNLADDGRVIDHQAAGDPVEDRAGSERR